MSWQARGVRGKFGAVVLSVFAVPFLFAEAAGLWVLVSLAGLAPTLGFGAMILMNALFYELLKAPTLIGRKTLDEIEGFKLYLSVAEEDRLNFIHPRTRLPSCSRNSCPTPLPWAWRMSGESGSRGCWIRPDTSPAGTRGGTGTACIREFSRQVWGAACSRPCPRRPPRQAAPPAWEAGARPAAGAVVAGAAAGNAGLNIETRKGRSAGIGPFAFKGGYKERTLYAVQPISFTKST